MATILLADQAIVPGELGRNRKYAFAVSRRVEDSEPGWRERSERNFAAPSAAPDLVEMNVVNSNPPELQLARTGD